MEHEELLFLADLPVVALLRFLDPQEVLFQAVLRGEGGAIDALEHGPAGVAPPVRAGDAQQLEALEHAGARHVGAAAHVGEEGVRVGAHDVVGNPLRELQLEGVVLLPEFPDHILALHLGAHEGMVLLRDLVHQLLDLLQILGLKGALHLEVVVEAVVDGGSDCQLRFREELHDGRGHEVGGGVPEYLQPFRRGERKELHPARLVDGGVEIHDPAVQTGRDPLGEPIGILGAKELSQRRAVVPLEGTAVDIESDRFFRGLGHWDSGWSGGR